jgi:hypothetical protein
MTAAAGSCLCKKVAFRVELPSKWVAHCHCSLCRRAHGAAFVTWVGMEQSEVHIDDAENLLRWYRSSPEAERGFCAACWTTLFFRSTRWPTELHVTLANFDGPVDRAPQGHVSFASRVDWFTVVDDLPKKADV